MPPCVARKPPSSPRGRNGGALWFESLGSGFKPMQPLQEQWFQTRKHHESRPPQESYIYTYPRNQVMLFKIGNNHKNNKPGNNKATAPFALRSQRAAARCTGISPRLPRLLLLVINMPLKATGCVLSSRPHLSVENGAALYWIRV